MTARRSSRDDALLARLVARDEGAWEALDRRHRPALRRWAASLSRPGVLDPDDIVQDVLVRAHRELAGGFVPDHLSAWLHRMVRNAAIDAARARASRGTEPLDEATVADVAGGPDVVIVRRERLRRVIDDMARLPDTQRRALVAVAVDDRPVDDIAGELGISAPAVRMTVRRARENLVRTEEARDATCERIREALNDAQDGGHRPSEQARLHLRYCSDCRAYRRASRRVDRRLRVLVPPLLPVAGLLGGGGATVGVAGKAVVAGVLVVAVTTGGALVEHDRVLGPGVRSPVTIEPGIVSDRTVRRGGSLPPGTWAVTAMVRLPAGVPPRGTERAVVLKCPTGTRATKMIFPARQRNYDVGYELDRAGLGGPSMRIVFDGRRLERPESARVGTLCRRRDRTGSLLYHPRRTRPGEIAMMTLPGTRWARRSPGGPAWVLLQGNQPVSVLGRARHGRWARVVSDRPGMRGWVLWSALRRPRPGGEAANGPAPPSP